MTISIKSKDQMIGLEVIKGREYITFYKYAPLLPLMGFTLKSDSSLHPIIVSIINTSYIPIYHPFFVIHILPIHIYPQLQLYQQ
jgi:hypothetical protein